MAESSWNYEDFKQVVAKFSATGLCGHAVERGDLIGYNKRLGMVCAYCWWKRKEERKEEVDKKRQTGKDNRIF